MGPSRDGGHPAKGGLEHKRQVRETSLSQMLLEFEYMKASKIQIDNPFGGHFLRIIYDI